MYAYIYMQQLASENNTSSQQHLSIKKLQKMYTMLYYSAIKKIKFCSYNLDEIRGFMLNEELDYKYKHNMILLLCKIYKQAKKVINQYLMQVYLEKS